MVIASAKYFSNAAVGMKWRNTQHCAVGRWILPSDLVIFKMIVRSVGGGGKFSSFICFLVLSQCTKKPWKALGIFLFLFSSFPSRNAGSEDCCKMRLCCRSFFFAPLKIPSLGERSSIGVVLGNRCFQHSETWWPGLQSTGVEISLVVSIFCQLWKSRCRLSVEH